MYLYLPPPTAGSLVVFTLSTALSLFLSSFSSLLALLVTYQSPPPYLCSCTYTYTFRTFAVSQILGSLLFRFLPLPLASPAQLIAGSFVHRYCMHPHTTYPPPHVNRHARVGATPPRRCLGALISSLVGFCSVRLVFLFCHWSCARSTHMWWIDEHSLILLPIASLGMLCACVFYAALTAFLSFVSALVYVSHARGEAPTMLASLRGAQSLFLSSHLVLPFLVRTRCPFVVARRIYTSASALYASSSIAATDCVSHRVSLCVFLAHHCCPWRYRGSLCQASSPLRSVPSPTHTYIPPLHCIHDVTSLLSSSTSSLIIRCR